jgi:hypothetical protein
VFDRREQQVCSRCASWVRYDCQLDPGGHERWWLSTREDAVGGVQPTTQEEAKLGQLFLQGDMRELSLHEIEFVSDHCDADVRDQQFQRVSAWRKLFDRGHELTIILLGIHC